MLPSQLDSTAGFTLAIIRKLCLSLCRRHGDDHNNYGRKLKQNVAGIVCDALGNCDDGHGRRYYDENHDNRCALAWALGMPVETHGRPLSQMPPQTGLAVVDQRSFGLLWLLYQTVGH